MPISMDEELSVFRLPNLADFKPGDDAALAIIEAVNQLKSPLQEGDILVIAHKMISKCEGAVVNLHEVEASQDAIQLAKEVNKDPRKVEVILSQSKRIVRAIKRPDQEEGVLIAEHKLGFICANAAVDESNADEVNQLITLPENPDKSAREICHRLEEAFACRIGVVISDTFGRPWRLGQTNVAIGLANVPAITHMLGDQDAFGHELKVTAPAFADELAGASGLLMSKSGKCPVIIFRGLEWQSMDSNASDLIRAANENLFK